MPTRLGIYYSLTQLLLSGVPPATMTAPVLPTSIVIFWSPNIFPWSHPIPFGYLTTSIVLSSSSPADTPRTSTSEMVATLLMLSSTATPPLTLPEITEDATVETAFTPVTTPNPESMTPQIVTSPDTRRIFTSGNLSRTSLPPPTPITGTIVTQTRTLQEVIMSITSEDSLTGSMSSATLKPETTTTEAITSQQGSMSIVSRGPSTTAPSPPMSASQDAPAPTSLASPSNHNSCGLTLILAVILPVGILLLLIMFFCRRWLRELAGRGVRTDARRVE